MGTIIAASAAGLVVLFWNKIATRKYLVAELCNGALGGLVSITAACNAVTDWSAFIIGVIGGFVYVLGQKLLAKLNIDDAISASPVHGICGIWGVIAVGFFSSRT